MSFSESELDPYRNFRETLSVSALLAQACRVGQLKAETSPRKKCHFFQSLPVAPAAQVGRDAPAHKSISVFGVMTLNLDASS